jgi:2-iminobutanoate/2-iminopropanoate deaminase
LTIIDGKAKFFKKKRATMAEDREQITTPNAPPPIGPYSQAVRAGRFLFVSGQLPENPADSIAEQTAQVLDRIEAILRAAGMALEHVVKTEVYLQDLQDFQEMNTLYAKRFSHPIKPARQTIQAARLPLHARIEISCIAYK